jgi:hypothetical protein
VRKPKLESPVSAKPARQWESFERVVASIQRLFSPGVEVSHNEKIPDIRNRPRQFDVVFRGDWAGQKLLGVMECRDKSRPVDLPQIDAFITKSRSVKANIAVMVSRAGYTREAISLAKDSGIGTLSLLPEEGSDIGFAIGFQSYVRFFEWTRLDVTVQAKGDLKLDGPLDIDSLKYEERSIVDWFKKKLSTDHVTRQELGWLTCVIHFDGPKNMMVNGEVQDIIAVKFSALREMRIKTKFLTISGQAFYDWQEQNWKWPPGGFIMTSPINHPTYSDWEDYKGDIPESTFALNLTLYPPCFDQKLDVIDLEKL